MIIIDGHNLLHAVNKIEGEYGGINDVGLCRIIGRYLKLTGRQGQIIFDGTGPQDKSGFDNMGELEVFFTGLNTDADTLIEQKIHASTAPKRLTIISSDRRLQKAARKRNAIPVKSEIFWNDMQKQINKKRPKKEPAEKHRGLSDGETKQWLEFFGFDK